jgi:hypothetical protein
MHSHISHQLSHSSSFFFAGALELPRIAAVPIALSAGFPKLSQKSFLLSSSGACLRPVPLISEPSTNRLNPSAAPFAPTCACLASCAAVSRAWVVMSASASYTFEISAFGSVEGWYLTNFLSCRLYIRVIDSLCCLAHGCCEPPKPPRQRRHWIFL